MIFIDFGLFVAHKPTAKYLTYLLKSADVAQITIGLMANFGQVFYRTFTNVFKNFFPRFLRFLTFLYFYLNVYYIYGCVCLAQSPPYLSIKKRKPDDEEEFEGNAKYEGYCADLAEAIAKRLREFYHIPFNYELSVVKDGLYGAKKDDGTWSGMIGELTRKAILQINSTHTHTHARTHTNGHFPGEPG